ncbi:MAG TPA: PAS domain S-box protein [Terriglobales bacterium]|nr:PAS domain S-box protein [Terriglobales bacterium]
MAEHVKPDAGLGAISSPIDPGLAQRFLDLINTIVIIGDEAGRIVYVSPGVERILGYSPPELLGEGAWLIPRLDPEQLRVQREYVARAARGEIPPRHEAYESCMTSKEGSPRWIVWRDSKGPGNLLIGVGQDITPLRMADEEVRKKQEEFEAIFHHASDSIMIFDEQENHIDVNPAACRLLGMPREQIINQKLGSLSTVTLDMHALYQRLLEGGPAEGEAVFRTQSGQTRHVEYSITMNFRPGFHLTILRDVTERKKLEKQLISSQRLEAVGRLAGGVAHDFNNMLTAIRGYAELILRRLPDDDQLRGYTEGILGASDKAALTIHQLLAFSRRQVMQLKILDINQAVTDTLQLLRPLIGEDIEVNVRLQAENAFVRVDPGQFSQMLVNLAVNSREAMPTGGTLTFESSNAELDEEYCRQHEQVTPGAYVLLTIADSGVGMDAHTQTHIFEPFFTTRENAGGTGLGMATVYGIVKQSRGFIWVYSEPGQGSTFKIYLPRVDSNTTQVAAAAQQNVRRSILVIEDDPETRTMIVGVLRGQGYQVWEASDGSAALTLLEHRSAPLDLLLTDVNAPGMSGEDLKGYIAARWPNTLTLTISGFSRERLIASKTLAPDSEFLSKPFSAHELITRVQQMLQPESSSD